MIWRRHAELELNDHLALQPLPPLHSQFHRSVAPILPMVVHATLAEPSPLQALFLVEDRQQSENHRDPRVQLNPHQSVADSVRDVFKVHRRTLDEHANRDNGIEGLLAARWGWGFGR